MIILTILYVIVIIILFVILSFCLLCFWASRQPCVKNDYFNKVNCSKPLEKKYTIKGNYAVSYFEQHSDDKTIKKFQIWYPSELTMNKNNDKKYPLVIMANGTGIMASRYKPVFDHLASWGFIVTGNEDGKSGNGKSSSITLDYMISLNSNKDSQFFNKIDLNNIGIGGHSQGGLGAMNAVINHNNGINYKVIYTASAPSSGLAGFLKASYGDISKLNIPYFQTAGTLKFDAGIDENSGIAPIWSLKEKFDFVPDNVTKIMARRVNTDHGDMLTHADGYMTAWFMYWLQNDSEAKKVFFGNDAEILFNQNWVDVDKNI